MHTVFENKFKLGSSSTICLVGESEKKLSHVLTELWDVVDIFEARFSRFIAGSELSKVNLAAGKKVNVSDEFLELLKTAMKMNKFSAGVFNPLILPALHQAGYVKTMSKYKNSDQEPADFSQRKVAQPQEIETGDDWLRLPVNSALDFGGLGKGYLADQLANLLDQNEHVSSYWVSLGGDLVTSGSDVAEKTWKVFVQNAHQPNADVARVIMPKRRLAVATSGTIKRRGKDWHHLIDPSTLRPAVTDILLATVLHSSCLVADITASWGVIRGSEKAVKIFEENQINDYLLQPKAPAEPVLSGQLIELI